ncbi:MAG: drug/metabolite transporter (DMT)-like permease [Planctomycetota bacterium]|jgi:drug/metabolite transporter (DMT)-like permease
MARTVLLTVVALLAFAGNSMLCRLALRDHSIDPWSFTAIRLASGAILLLPLLWPRTPSNPKAESRKPGPPWAAAALLVYALAFSLAYVSLDTGTGALLLFGTVQITMIAVGVRNGERPTAIAAAGMLLAILGVVWLVLPGVQAPDALGALLMTIAGIAWGTYSLLGRGATEPSRATARNFALAAPVAGLAMAVAFTQTAMSAEGIWLAIAAGVVTSGIGYVIWYMALPGLSATSAAIVQLSVPMLAAFGGITLLGEQASTRLLAATAMTLAGVAMAVLSRK